MCVGYSPRPLVVPPLGQLSLSKTNSFDQTVGARTSSAGELKVEWTPTADNEADLLTKTLPADAYHRHRTSAFNIPQE